MRNDAHKGCGFGCLFGDNSPNFGHVGQGDGFQDLLVGDVSIYIAENAGIGWSFGGGGGSGVQRGERHLGVT